MGGEAITPVEAQKIALRDRLLTERRRLSLLEVGQAAAAIAEQLLATDQLRHAATVAAYVSVGTEPGTGPLLDALVAAGRRVLLPVLMPDDDLDWACYSRGGPGASTGLVRARRGLLEPDGAPLGPEAVTTADVVLAPGLAADRTGMRLGRGGGSYDRVLARIPSRTFTCVLLYDGEVLERVPADVHDRPVTAAATPSGITWFGSASG